MLFKRFGRLLFVLKIKELVKLFNGHVFRVGGSNVFGKIVSESVD